MPLKSMVFRFDLTDDLKKKLAGAGGPKDLAPIMREGGLDLAPEAADQLWQAVARVQCQLSRPDPHDAFNITTLTGGDVTCSLNAPPLAALSVTVPAFGPGERAERIEAASFDKAPAPTEIVVPEGVTRLADFCFMDCAALKRAVIPEGVREIPPGCFLRCGQLEEIVIPGTVTAIGNWAFMGCGSLRRVALPKALTEVGYGAFRDCIRLAVMTAPPGLSIRPERNVFGHGRPLLPENRSPIDEARAFPALENALDDFAYACIDAAEAGYTFIIRGIDPSDESAVEKVVGDVGANILAFLDDCVTYMHSNPGKIRWIDMMFLRDIIVSTLYHTGAELFDYADSDVLPIYAQALEANDMTGFRFLRVAGRWYALAGDWSD